MPRILIPSSFKVFILRFWGAEIGQNVLIKPNIRVQFPWKLKVGSNCWIGENVWIINHDLVKIGSNVCISQRSIICSSNHDFKSTQLNYAHQPVHIQDGAWICLDAKVLPGVTIGVCSVVLAGEVAKKSLPDYSKLSGGIVTRIPKPS